MRRENLKFIISLIAVSISVFLFLLNWRMVSVMERELEVNKRMVNVIEEEFRLAKRPYVGINKVNSVKYVNEDGRVVAVEFELEEVNVGTLPAVVSRCSLKCFVGDGEIKLNKVHGGDNIILFPGQIYRLKSGKIDDLFVPLVKEKKTLFFEVKIEYSDFKQSHSYLYEGKSKYDVEKNFWVPIKGRIK